MKPGKATMFDSTHHLSSVLARFEGAPCMKPFHFTVFGKERFQTACEASQEDLLNETLISYDNRVQIAERKAVHRTWHCFLFPFKFSTIYMALSSLDKTCIILSYQVGISV